MTLGDGVESDMADRDTDVRVLPEEALSGNGQGRSPEQIAADHPLAAPLRQAIVKTRHWLVSRQHTDGHWCGELEGDSILESETILLLAYLGREDTDLARRAAQYLIEQQLPEGGWAQYPGGGVDISGSVKAYFALKLTGHHVGAEYMQRARAAILAHGGADAVNSFTRFYLALLGQIDYRHCPAVPPEMVLLPNWFPVNLYRISSWSRGIVVPLSIMWAHRPVRRLDPQRGIRELFLKDPRHWEPLNCSTRRRSKRLFGWTRFFCAVDLGLKLLERLRIRPWRRRALLKAEQWMIQRFADSDGLGAIFPPIVWSLVALKCLGYDDDSDEVRYCTKQLEDLVLEEDDTVRLQPCKSPVWDTAIALRALAASGIKPQCTAAGKAVDWLLSKEVTRRGDWAQTTAAEPGGWFFEYRNEFYPDVDDTTMVLMALREAFAQRGISDVALPPGLELVADAKVEGMPQARLRAAMVDRIASAVERGRRWMLAMQNRDGGWGAFDRNNDAQFLCHVPFADHNAMIDPSTPDLTGRVLESLGCLGWTVAKQRKTNGASPVDRAVAYLRKTQEPDGSWFGRWGVNHIYGTWQAIVGLTAVGVPRDDPAVVAGANWLLAYQQASGGWGESPDSYTDPATRGQGPATASQTAWAVMGLTAAGMHRHEGTVRGIEFLLHRQEADGTWEEPEFTGTGFPRVFYLRYHYYPIYFPLLALSKWAVAISGKEKEAGVQGSGVRGQDSGGRGQDSGLRVVRGEPS